MCQLTDTSSQIGKKPSSCGIQFSDLLISSQWPLQLLDSSKNCIIKISPFTFAIVSSADLILLIFDLEVCLSLIFSEFVTILIRNSVSSAKYHFPCSGFAVAGTQFSTQCFCDDTFGDYVPVDETECDGRCTGDTTQICGGTWRLSAWRNSKYSNRYRVIYIYNQWHHQKVMLKTIPQCIILEFSGTHCPGAYFVAN